MADADGLFDSAWLKWGRAVVHAQALHEDIERFAHETSGEALGAVRFDYMPKRHGFSVVVTEEPKLPTNWTLLLGDAVHDFRCALDHVAWALVRRGRTPSLSEDKARRVYFPIGGSAGHLRYLLEKGGRLPGVRRPDVAIVRRYQPYLRGKARVQWHCFTVLEALSNDDKHREVKGLWMIVETPQNELTVVRDCEVVDARGYRTLMKAGREVAFVRVRKTGPHPQIEMNHKGTAYPAFDDSLWLPHWLFITAETVRRLLLEFADAPEEVQGIGIDLDYVEAASASWWQTAALWHVSGRRTPGLESL